MKPLFEDDFIAFRMFSLGHILVYGELFDYSEETQHLRFAFRTDQTVLKPLIADLRSLQ